ncbi:MAG: hypothetical protein ACK56I_02995, partial [bacterium]
MREKGNKPRRYPKSIRDGSRGFTPDPTGRPGRCGRQEGSAPRATSRDLLRHRAAHHVAQSQGHLLALLADEEVGGTRQRRRQRLAQAVLEHEVDPLSELGHHLVLDGAGVQSRRHCPGWCTGRPIGWFGRNVHPGHRDRGQAHR